MLQKAKKHRLLYGLIVIFSLLVSVKMILVGYSHDEEYQIVMAYRQVLGDTLFGTMWEPHQTSAWINALFILLYTRIVGSTTGIIIFLRIMGCLLHGGMSVLVYKTIRSFSFLKDDRLSCFLLAAMYYNTTVSLFAEAEYSNMLYWSSTLLVIFLCNLLKSKEEMKQKALKTGNPVGCAISLCLMILSFPPMVLFTPVVLIFIFLLSDRQVRGKNTLAFTLAGGTFGILYSLLQIAQVGLSTFLATIPRIVSNDNTHELTDNSYWYDKLPAAVHSIGIDVVIFLGILAVALGAGVFVNKKKVSENKEHSRREFSQSLVITVAGIGSILTTIFFWLCRGEGFEAGQIFILTGLAGVLYYTIRYEKGKEKFLLAFILVMALFNLLVGYMFSNMEFEVKLPHLVYVIVVWMILYVKQMSGSSEVKIKRMLYGNLFLWLVFFMFAKGFMLRSGAEKNNILSTNNICRSGPALGIMSDYMHTYIMDRTYEEWDNFVQEGDTVLIVSRTLHSDVITSYLFKKINIAHYAVNNPYSYTEALLAYWELYPEKKPNVIMIDCWFGQPMIGEDEWIMQYIENEFGYTSVLDGDYLRYYRK